MSTLDLDEIKGERAKLNVTVQNQSSVSDVQIFDKTYDSHLSSKSGMGNTLTSKLAPKMSEHAAMKY